MIDKDTPIFDDIALSDLFSDIYKNSKNKSKDISGLLTKLMGYINKPEDAALLMPLIKEYLDVSVKNDDQLIKLAQIIQKLIMTTTGNMSTGNQGMILTEEEKKQLLSSINSEDENVEKLIKRTEQVLRNYDAD